MNSILSYSYWFYFFQYSSSRFRSKA